MKHEVFWTNPGYRPFPPLRESMKCDYLIVGGGITGVSLAYFLANAGEKNIILVEKNTIASGATGHAAGSLVASAEIDLKDLVRKHGTKKSARHWRMLEDTLNEVKRIIREEKIPCDFETMDTLYGGIGRGHEAILREEFSRLKKINLQTQLIRGEELRACLNSPLFFSSIYSPKGGVSVNPLQLTQNLSKVAARKGVRVFEQTAVHSIKGKTAHTQHGMIAFKKVIWAVDAAHPDERVSNYKTTILVTRPLTMHERKQTGLWRKKILWDANANYSYGKMTLDNRLLIGFGGVTVPKGYRRKDAHTSHVATAKKWLHRLFPYLNVPIEYAWSATYGVTKDHRPLVEMKKGVYSIAGAGSQVLCVMAAKELAKKLAGKKHQLNLVYL